MENVTLVKLQAKSNFPPWVFFKFLSFTHGTNGRKESHLRPPLFVQNKTSPALALRTLSQMQTDNSPHEPNLRKTFNNIQILI